MSTLRLGAKNFASTKNIEFEVKNRRILLFFNNNKRFSAWNVSCNSSFISKITHFRHILVKFLLKNTILSYCKVCRYNPMAFAQGCMHHFPSCPYYVVISTHNQISWYPMLIHTENDITKLNSQNYLNDKILLKTFAPLENLHLIFDLKTTWKQKLLFRSGKQSPM